MTNKELKKISDELFTEDRNIDYGYKSFCREILWDVTISIGFIVFVLVSIILMIS